MTTKGNTTSTMSSDRGARILLATDGSPGAAAALDLLGSMPLRPFDEIIFYVSEANRLAAAIGVAVFFFLAAGIVAWVLHRLADTKPRAFDATLSELQRDLTAIKS